MKTAFKNFIMTLKRYKAASLLNVAGLTLAFVSFYIIMAQVYNAMTFNCSIKDNERVYIVSPYKETFGGWNENAPNPVSYETAEALPFVESVASMKSYYNSTHVWVKNNMHNYEKFEIGVTDCNSPLLDVFSFNIISGNADDFKQMNAAVVSESAARRMGVNVGDIINLEEGELKPGLPLNIVAIFEDFEENTILGGKHIFRNDNRQDGMVNNNWNYSVFVKMQEDADPDEYISLWQKKYRVFNEQMFAEYIAATGREVPEKQKKELLDLPINLLSMDKIYFYSEFEDYPCGSLSITMTQLAIALVIVIVAFINFVNFFMALIPVRMRSVNICKVFGASGRTLRWNFVIEAIGLVFMAIIIALYLVFILQGSIIGEFVNCSLAISDNIPTVIIVCAIATLMAVTAAVYPAFYITSFNASLAVKRGFASSKAGRFLRSGLIALQFTVSMILTLLALVFSLQYSYMVRYDVGVNRENMLVIKSEQLATRYELFMEKLENNPNISAVTASSWEMFGNSDCNSRLINDIRVEMNVNPVHYNAPEVFGIPIIDGNGFTKGKPGYLITDYTSLATGLGIGDKWDNEEIVGIIPHINLGGANKELVNTALYNHGKAHSRTNFYVRLNKNVDVKAVYDDIRQIAKEINPNIDAPTIEFLNDAIAKIYGDTKKQTVIIALFAIIAVVISLMGVFGIVMFETQHRRSEIAVRKVYGATTGSIVMMLNRRYLAIIIACFAVSAPVAYFIATNWLQQFVNRINLSAWLFAAVFTVITIVVTGLVTLRSRKAATENPADVVKSI